MNFLPHSFSYPLYLGGFSAYAKYLEKKLHYHHIFTTFPLQEAVALFPHLQIGLGQAFDGLLEHENHYYLFYFIHDLEVFQDFKNQKESFSFNKQALFYHVQKDVFINCLNQKLSDKNLDLLQPLINPDVALEAILISLLASIPFNLSLQQIQEKKGSPLFFRFVVEEFFKHGIAYQGFLKMEELGLLSFYLPELIDLKGIHHDKDYHPEGDALEHILECLKYYQSNNLILGWAIVLHDLGKALAEKSGKRRFDNHAQLGVNLAKKVLQRMGYPQDFQEKVLFLVEHHMHPIFIPYMDDFEKASLISHPLSKELLQLFKIDIMGSHKNMDFYNRMKTLLNRSSL